MPHHTANSNTSLHDHGHCTLRHQSRSPTRRLHTAQRNPTTNTSCRRHLLESRMCQPRRPITRRTRVENRLTKRSHCPHPLRSKHPASVRRREVVKHPDPDPARIGDHHGKRTVQLSEIYIWRPIRLAHPIGGVTARLTNSPAPHVQGRHDHLRKSSSVFKIVSTRGLLKIAGTVPSFTIASTVALFSAHVRPGDTRQNPQAPGPKRNVSTDQRTTATTRNTSDQTRHPPRQLASSSRVSTDIGKTEGASDELISAIPDGLSLRPILVYRHSTSRFSRSSTCEQHSQGALLLQTATDQHWARIRKVSTSGQHPAQSPPASAPRARCTPPRCTETSQSSFIVKTYSCQLAVHPTNSPSFCSNDMSIRTLNSIIFAATLTKCSLNLNSVFVKALLRRKLMTHVSESALSVHAEPPLVVGAEDVVKPDELRRSDDVSATAFSATKALTLRMGVLANPSICNVSLPMRGFSSGDTEDSRDVFTSATPCIDWQASLNTRARRIDPDSGVGRRPNPHVHHAQRKAAQVEAFYREELIGEIEPKQTRLHPEELYDIRGERSLETPSV